MPPWTERGPPTSLDGLRERWAPCLLTAVAGHTVGGAGRLSDTAAHDRACKGRDESAC
jgi:hypothetical protein